MAGTLHEAWQAIESSRREITAQGTRITSCEKDIAHIREKQDDTCDQLKKTDENITALISRYQIATDAKLDLLINEYHKQQGSKAAVSWLPTIISCIVGALAIYAFVSGGAA